MRALLAVALLALTALAGCATDPVDPSTPPPPPPPPPPTVPFDQMPEGAGHDHADPASHKFLWNYEFTARDPLMSNPANIAGLHAMDLQDGFLFGAIYGSHGASVDGGMQIWDVQSDPTQPKALGRWTIPGSVGGDRSIGATADGDYAVIGLEPVDCLGHVNPIGAATSAYLLDTRDKQRPVVSDIVTPAGSGGSPAENPTKPHVSSHSVFVHRINGTDYAFIFGQIYEISRDEAAGAKLVYVGSVSTGHDIYVRDTPWNRTWALSANGEGGLVIFDVTDPAKAFEIATWDREDHDEMGYYFHTADVAFVEGQTLVVLTSEDFGPHVSPFWVLDGNPLTAITAAGQSEKLNEIGEWHNPYNHTAANIRFSLHNPRFHDGAILTISSYHAGMFQLDLRQPHMWEHPQMIAAIAYAEGDVPLTNDPVESAVEGNLCQLGITVDAPMYMDVAVGSNGTLYLGDVFMGLYTFVPTVDHPVFGARVAGSA